MVNFNDFQKLDPEAADLARELIGASVIQHSAFFSFMSIWMGFNGWMECITDAPNDAEMIMALADHPRLASAFRALAASSVEFRTQVGTFGSMWPVLNVRDVRRKLGRDAFWRYSREELMNEVLRRGVKHQPVGYDGGAPTWPQLLRTIYLVRCNLFHGSKSPQNYRDHQLVVNSDQILRMFIEGSGCFDWGD